MQTLQPTKAKLFCRKGSQLFLVYRSVVNSLFSIVRSAIITNLMPRPQIIGAGTIFLWKPSTGSWWQAKCHHEAIHIIIPRSHITAGTVRHNFKLKKKRYRKMFARQQ
jgi:hypothetical protein